MACVLGGRQSAYQACLCLLEPKTGPFSSVQVVPVEAFTSEVRVFAPIIAFVLFSGSHAAHSMSLDRRWRVAAALLIQCLMPVQTPSTNAESYERLAEDPAKAKVTVGGSLPVPSGAFTSHTHFPLILYVTSIAMHACSYWPRLASESQIGLIVAALAC